MAISLTDVLIVAATLLSPVIALHVQRRLDSARERRHRRAWVFQTLMATRAARVAAEHVQALNMIDLEFCSYTWRGAAVHGPKDAPVQVAWKAYRDHLGDRATELTEDAAARWLERGEDLFVQLLFEMSRSLGYAFDKTDLKRGIYSPQAHGDLERDQTVIRKGMAALFQGRFALPLELKQQPEDIRAAKDLQASIAAIANGDHPLRVECTK